MMIMTMIESILIGKPLFIINLNPQENQEVVQCMADKKLWARRQFHPLILDFLDEEQENPNHPLYGEVRIEVLTEYKRNGFITMPTQIIILLENGMIG